MCTFQPNTSEFSMQALSYTPQSGTNGLQIYSSLHFMQIECRTIDVSVWAMYTSPLPMTLISKNMVGLVLELHSELGK